MNSKWSLIGIVGMTLTSPAVGVAQEVPAKAPAVAATQAEAAKPDADATKTADVPVDELILVPIETALDPPAPGEKRDEPSLKHADSVGPTGCCLKFSSPSETINEAPTWTGQRNVTGPSNVSSSQAGITCCLC